MFGNWIVIMGGLVAGLLLIGSIVLITPLLLAVVICAAIIGIYLAAVSLTRRAPDTTGSSGAASRPAGEGARTQESSRGGAPASGEGGDTP